MADVSPKPGGKKIFGLPRNVAIIAIASGVLLVLYFWYRSKQSGANAQAQLPASSDVSAADPATAAPSLGGTPSGDGSGLGAADPNLVAGFQSQEQLISELSGGYEQLALTSEQQLGALAAALINFIPPPGQTTSSSTASSNGSGNGNGGSAQSDWGPPAAVNGVPGGFIVTNGTGGVAINQQVQQALAAPPPAQNLRKPLPGFAVAA